MRPDFIDDDFIPFEHEYDDDDPSHLAFIGQFLPHVLAFYIVIAMCSALALFVKGLTQHREHTETKLSQQISEAFDQPGSWAREYYTPLMGEAKIYEEEDVDGTLVEELQLRTLRESKPGFADLPQTVHFRAGQGERKGLGKMSVGEKRKVDVEGGPVSKRRMS